MKSVEKEIENVTFIISLCALLCMIPNLCCAHSQGCVHLFATPWTVACQAPLSMEFSRQKYWSGLPFPSPGDLPNPGIKPVSPALAGRFFTAEPPGKPIISYLNKLNRIESEFVLEFILPILTKLS